MGIVDFVFSNVKNIQDKYKKYFGSSQKEYDPLFTDPTLNKIFESINGPRKEKLTDHFKQLPIVYSCINSKARNIASVPWRFYKVGSEQEVPYNDPIKILFDSPNMLMTGNDLFYGIEAFLCSKGEFFLYPDIENTYRGIPINIFLFNPSDVKQWAVAENWAGWEVKLPDGKTKKHIEKNDMFLGKYWNPDNMLRGLSPISSLALTDSVRYNAMLFQDSFFKNDATPPIVFSMEETAQPRNLKEFKNMIRQRRGAANAGKELILHGGWKASTLTPSNKDIQVLKLLEATTDEICAVFGVPKTELSIRDGLNYATAISEDRGYWKKTLLPDLQKIKSTINEWLNSIGYRADPDLRSIPSLNYEWLELVDAAEKLHNMGFKLVEINEKLGFGFEDVQEPTKQQIEPIQTNSKAISFEIPKVEEISICEMGKAARAAIWKKLDEEVRGPEARIKAAVRKYFIEVEKKTLRKIEKKISAAETKAAEDVPTIDDLMEFISDEKLERYIKGHIEDASKKGVESIGVNWEAVDEEAGKAVKSRVDKVKQINDTLRQELRDMISNSISDGLPAKELAKKITEGFSEKMSLAKGRAKTIARTETNSAYSDGRFLAMDSTDPIGKKWISSASGVRELHQETDGQVVKWNDFFSNGLSRPHDPGGSAKNVINCRCKMVAIYDPEELPE